MRVKRIFTFYFLKALMLCFMMVGMLFSQYKVGDKVSDFTLNDLNGDPVSLFSFSGNVILLNFFATW